MPNKDRQGVIPEGRFERAAWVEEHLPTLLESVPLQYSWAGVAELERQLFSSLAKDFLGGHLDPVCPACGVATEQGTVARAGEYWRVTYQSCGDVFDWTEAELQSRVRRAGDA